MIRIALLGCLLLAGCAAAPELLTGAAAPSGDLAAQQGTALPPPELAGRTQTPAAPAPSPLDGFDPGQQRFVWVLPPGIHGKGPWSYTVAAKVRGETKHESVIPLKAEMLPAGSRPEYPAGYEIIRLTDDGSWRTHAAELERVIEGLIAQHGRGSGQLDLNNRLELTVDASHRQAYCIDNQTPDARLYLDEPGKELQRLDTAMDNLFRGALQKACEG